MLIYAQDPDFDYTKLKRSVECQGDYLEHLGILEAENMTPEEYILESVFDHTAQQLAIVPNMFPYDLPEGQSHWLLWCRYPEFLGYVKSYIFDTFYKKNIYAIWQNDPKDQSVKNLTHFHFILLD